MKRSIIIAILCCVIPLAIVGLILIYGGERVDHSTMPGWQDKTKLTVGTAPGNIFPAFSVIDIDGASITNETLKGKPAIIWFTTSWCVPCQIGARDVSRLDNELTEKLLKYW